MGTASGCRWARAACKRSLPFMKVLPLLSRIRQMVVLVILALAAAVSPAAAERVTVPLDGTWQVGESVAATPVPTSFSRRAPVPGLANLAEPRIPGRGSVRQRGEHPQEGAHEADARIGERRRRGIPRQNRNYFWYRRAFRAPAKKAGGHAQDQQGAVRHRRVAEREDGRRAPRLLHARATSISRRRSSGRARIELVVRIGAHPAALPATAPRRHGQREAQVDPRHLRRGLACCLADNPVIESVQVAPRMATSEILVQTRAPQLRPGGRSFTLHADAWKARRIRRAEADARSGRSARPGAPDHPACPARKLWTPETPILYTLEPSTGGDTALARVSACANSASIPPPGAPT